MSNLGIVADDLTGATTVGALIARDGVEATVLFNVEHIENTKGTNNSAIIVSTDSRPVDAEVAFKRVALATKALKENGAKQFSKRIDTTCRGGVGPETEGMLSELPESYVAVVVPAMPQSKRIVVGGFSLIDSVLLSRTQVAQDVRTPVRESHLPTLFAKQFNLPLAEVNIGSVVSGKEAIASQLRKKRETGVKIFVVDAVTMEDVDQIAQAVVDLGWSVVCVDPGPFTERFAVRSEAIVPSKVKKRQRRLEQRTDDKGTVLVVAGSATEITHKQIGALCSEPGTVAVGAKLDQILISEDSFAQECRRVVSETSKNFVSDKTPRVFVLALDTVLTGKRATVDELAQLSGIDGKRASDLLTARLAKLAQIVVDNIGSNTLVGAYLTGGDVMVATCRALETRGIRLIDYVIPQIDQGVLDGGLLDGKPVVCKGGLTGDINTAIESVNRIFDEGK